MLLVDTNIWLAAADRRSARHHDCSTLLADHTGQLAATVPVIAETAWLLLDRGGPAAQNRFLALVPTARLEPVDLTASDWARILDLVETYADLASMSSTPASSLSLNASTPPVASSPGGTRSSRS